MSTKEEVLSYLQQHTDANVSGEQLADILGISRSAVWKAIKSLRQDGYTIDAATHKGYRLSCTSDILSAARIAAFSHSTKEAHIHVYDETDSTNARAKALALQGAPHGTLVVANAQTGGRGRLGRAFVSPAKSGIYMSIILRPDADLSKAMLITTATSVAVCRVIRRLTGRPAGIKWVNDIYIDEKKVCGILTEAVTDFETGGLESVVVGIGINYKANRDAFPADVLERITFIYDDDGAGGAAALDADEDVSAVAMRAAVTDEKAGRLDDRAGCDGHAGCADVPDDCVCYAGRTGERADHAGSADHAASTGALDDRADHAVTPDDRSQPTRNELVAAILDETLGLCGNLDDSSFLDEYRRDSIILGRDIICIRGDERTQARAVDIDDKGGLIVVTADGERKVLSSGEVSIRW